MTTGSAAGGVVASAHTSVAAPGIAAVVVLLAVFAAFVAYVARFRPPSEPADPQRWEGREWLSRSLVVLAYLIPVGAAVGVTAFLSHQLNAPHGAWAEARDWTFLLAVSSAVVYVVERLSRRLLPLAALLKLSLLFPDQAPRRIVVARRAGSIRHLKERIEYAKEHGVADEPARAAAGILELVGALHAHDRHTRGHSERVRMFTDLLASELRLDPEDQDRLRWSALLHDIGKLHVSPRILNKPGRPEPKEWAAIHRHPEDGARLAAPLAPWLGAWADTIVQHHERWDGMGYPHRLQGREISFGARIVGVADAYEVMTAARTYKKAMSVAAARRELTRNAGTQFDPAMVRAFLAISIGRLRWAASPVSWVAQLPFIGWLPQVAQGVATAGSQAAGVVAASAGATLAATAGTVGIAASPPPAPTPPASTVPAAPASHISTSVLGETLVRNHTASQSHAVSHPAPTTTTTLKRSTSTATTAPGRLSHNTTLSGQTSKASTPTSLLPNGKLPGSAGSGGSGGAGGAGGATSGLLTTTTVVHGSSGNGNANSNAASTHSHP